MSESLNQQIDSLKAIYKSQLDPRGRAFVSLADAHRRLGDLDEALAVIQDGLGTHPDFASAHMVAGLVHRARREPDDAMRAFERVLELDSENSLAQAAIAELIDDQRAEAYRDKMEAKELAEQAAEASAVDESPAVSIAPPEEETSVETSAEPSVAPDHDRPVRPIESLAPGAPAETASAPSVPESIPADDRPVVPIESLALEAPVETSPAEVEATPDAPSGLAPEGIGRPVVPIASLTPEVEPEVAVRPVVPAPSLAPGVAPVDDGRPVVPAPSPAPEGQENNLVDLSPVAEEIYTETLAELYAGQGATEKAIETYRKMLVFDPDNEAFRRRLVELESLELSSHEVPAASSMPTGPEAPSPVERQTVPIESLAPDGDPGDGASADPPSRVNKL